MQAAPVQTRLYPQFDTLDFPAIEQEILAFWEEEKIFEQSVENRPKEKSFTFYEGPPSANGKPGIHHVMARAIKDLFCRYHTLKGQRVERKGGWDTHGLPIELQVEKEIVIDGKVGITKKDIGVKISVEDYNRACRQTVMRFKAEWDDLTRKMGYWVDLDHPYITFENNYIESVWALLKKLYDKGLLYKGYTIQPYSPAAGTGLSSHELNQPGTYKEVKDISVTAMFELEIDSRKKLGLSEPTFVLAWTTTPWTLPANTALTVGKNIEYVVARTHNPYTGKAQNVILAEALLNEVFNEETKKRILKETGRSEGETFEIIQKIKGSELAGLRYKQLLPYIELDEYSFEKAFKIILGDFVTTEDGTGIVHTSPTFGADDMRVARQNGVPPILVRNNDQTVSPIVDLQGKYVDEMKGNGELPNLAGRYVKDYTDDPNFKSLDEDIAIYLKLNNGAFNVHKYEHTYPHCWRTDKPVLYYPLDSWFIKTTEKKEELIALNKTINWKPASTGTGRFGNWLENLDDWNLSRSRFWGTPLPIWMPSLRTSMMSRTNRGYRDSHCIGSIQELWIETSTLESLGTFKAFEFIDYDEKKSRLLPSNRTVDNYDVKYLDEPHKVLLNDEIGPGRIRRLIEENKLVVINQQDQILLDVHKPFIDYIVFIHRYIDKNGEEQLDTYFREPDLIDVWFDSGAMPYAQWHYPFENKEKFEANFPADFIAEGVDQTRGWFFTLHAIAVMTENQVAYKNVISNGLVLDAKGNKMSKRLGNAVDPFDTISKYGADPTRWYMIENAPPWENLRFNLANLEETQRKFFGTLYNTYSFFALYANIDGWRIEQFDRVPQSELPELDRWILSRLNSLVQEVRTQLDDYDPTRAARAIQEFVVEELSNWYVRLSRRRFWKGDLTADKRAAFETLQHCLAGVAQLMSPIAPFFADWLYRNLTESVRAESIARDTPFKHPSVHLTDLMEVEQSWMDPALEERMRLAQEISSLAVSIRKKLKLRVRQPLGTLLVAVKDEAEADKIEAVAELIRTEVNIKLIEYTWPGKADGHHLVRTIKANFKTLGSRLGARMKPVAEAIAALGPQVITQFEQGQQYELMLGDETILLQPEDVEIRTADIPGWSVASAATRTVALDITLTEDLLREGLARELINRVQNLRKDSGLEVTDFIQVKVQPDTEAYSEWNAAFEQYNSYICTEILATQLLVLTDSLTTTEPGFEIELEGKKGLVWIAKDQSN